MGRSLFGDRLSGTSPEELHQIGRRRDPEALAEVLAGLLANQQQAQQLAVAGRVLAGREYSMDSMAQRLQQALKDYI